MYAATLARNSEKNADDYAGRKRLCWNLALILVSVVAILSGALIAAVSGNIFFGKMVASLFLVTVLTIQLPMLGLLLRQRKRAVDKAELFVLCITLFFPSGVLLV